MRTRLFVSVMLHKVGLGPPTYTTVIALGG
jgi:hypothetical protein